MFPLCVYLFYVLPVCIFVCFMFSLCVYLFVLCSPCVYICLFMLSLCVYLFVLCSPCVYICLFYVLPVCIFVCFMFSLCVYLFVLCSPCVYICFRFPLFGGRQTRYYYGYNLPSYKYLYHHGNQYLLKICLLDHVVDDQFIQRLTVKIILPEGAK